MKPHGPQVSKAPNPGPTHAARQQQKVAPSAQPKRSLSSKLETRPAPLAYCPQGLNKVTQPKILPNAFRRETRPAPPVFAPDTLKSSMQQKTRLSGNQRRVMLAQNLKALVQPLPPSRQAGTIQPGFWDSLRSCFGFCGASKAAAASSSSSSSSSVSYIPLTSISSSAAGSAAAPAAAASSATPSPSSAAASSSFAAAASASSSYGSTYGSTSYVRLTPTPSFSAAASAAAPASAAASSSSSSSSSGSVRLLSSSSSGANHTVDQGDISVLVSTDSYDFGLITSCSVVLARNSTTGKAVVYHWPFTMWSTSYIEQMTKALKAIDWSVRASSFSIHVYKRAYGGTAESYRSEMEAFVDNLKRTFTPNVQYTMYPGRAVLTMDGAGAVTW